MHPLRRRDLDRDLVRHLDVEDHQMLVHQLLDHSNDMD